MAAVFPQAAACQENVTGPIEIPDHVLVRQTIDDTLHEALDVDGLRALLERIEVGRRSRCTASTPPSRRCSRTRSSPPGRTRSSTTRSSRTAAPTRSRCGAGSTVDLASIGALDPDAIEQVHDEITPEPDDRRRPPRPAELARASPGARDEWRALCDELVERGRGQRARPRRRASCGARPSAHDDAGRALAGDDDAVAAVAARPPRDRRHHHRRRARRRHHASPPPRVDAGLARARARGLRAAGSLHRRAQPTPSGWRAGCSPACTRTRAAPAASGVEPATAQDFMRFLLRWQHVAPGTQLAGEAGLLAVIEQLQGYEAAAVGVGARAARRAGCAATTRRGSTGSATTARSAGCGSRRAPRDDADAPAGAPSKATPISVVFRDDLAVAARGGARRRRSRRADGRRDRRGRSRCCASAARASPPSSARPPTGSPKTSSAALWDGVARGLLTSDGFGAIRARVDAARARHRAARGSPGCCAARAARGRRRPVAGRSCRRHRPPTSTATSSPRRSPSCCSTAGACVFRDLAVHDSLRFPWRDVQWALRRLEDRGLVRGGRFVTGFSGEQYALPDGGRAAHPGPQGAPDRRAGHA